MTPFSPGLRLWGHAEENNPYRRNGGYAGGAVTGTEGAETARGRGCLQQRDQRGNGDRVETSVGIWDPADKPHPGGTYLREKPHPAVPQTDAE